jgi:hypothetical protein
MGNQPRLTHQFYLPGIYTHVELLPLQSNTPNRIQFYQSIPLHAQPEPTFERGDQIFSSHHHLPINDQNVRKQPGPFLLLFQRQEELVLRRVKHLVYVFKESDPVFLENVVVQSIRLFVPRNVRERISLDDGLADD